MPPSTPPESPKAFGERFRERGLIGALGKSVKTKADPNKMHFLDHLEEMRWVILKCIVALLMSCILVAVFLDDAVHLLKRPLISAVQDFGSLSIDLQAAGLSQYEHCLEQQGVTLSNLIHAEDKDLLAWGITDNQHRMQMLLHFAGGKDRNILQVIRSYSPIFIAMKICFLGGLGISLPFVLYFISGFVVPGLTHREKSVFFPGCIAATFLFLAGSGMTYFFILPLSLAFTIEFSFNVLGLEIYRPEAGNYYSTVIWMTFAVGLAFQFPLILILLIRIGVLNVKKLQSSRRFVLVILMISAALITPGGDPVSLCILTIPLYFLFEISILVGKLVEKNNLSQESAHKNRSEITGSIIMLLGITVVGSLTGWLYFNWEKAEALFLSLPSDSPTSPNLPSVQPNSLAHPEFLNGDFILELYPQKLSIDANYSIPPPQGIYRARIHPQKK